MTDHMMNFHAWLIKALSFGRPFILNCDVIGPGNVGIIAQGNAPVISGCRIENVKTAIMIVDAVKVFADGDVQCKTT